MALSYSNEPLCIGTEPDEDNEHLSFQVFAPGHLVARALSEPKQFRAVPFSMEQGGGAYVAKEILISFYGEADRMDRQSTEALALSALDVIIRAINEQGGQNVIRSV